MSDIVSDLQSFNEEKLNSEPYTCEEIAKAAADEITRLREENARLREALKDLIKDHEYETSSDEEEDKFFKARSVARAAIREGGKDDAA